MGVSIDDLKLALSDIVENKEITEIAETDLLSLLQEYFQTVQITQSVYESWVDLVSSHPGIIIAPVVMDINFPVTSDTQGMDSESRSLSLAQSI